MKTLLQNVKKQHTDAVEGMFAKNEAQLIALAEACIASLKAGGKLIFCGNGGSACDAMHIAGEFVGRFVEDRKPIAAIALTSDSGIITAVANDYGYEHIFSRQIEALGNKGDVLIALSTSGKSPNVLKALEAGRAKGLKTALLTGEKGAGQASRTDMILVVPSAITAHVQEAHMAALHGLATLVESRFFPK